MYHYNICACPLWGFNLWYLLYEFLLISSDPLIHIPQRWLIVIQNQGDKFQWNLNQNTMILIDFIWLKITTCNMVAILSQLHCGNMYLLLLPPPPQLLLSYLHYISTDLVHTLPYISGCLWWMMPTTNQHWPNNTHWIIQHFLLCSFISQETAFVTLSDSLTCLTENIKTRIRFLHTHEYVFSKNWLWKKSLISASCFLKLRCVICELRCVVTMQNHSNSLQCIVYWEVRHQFRTNPDNHQYQCFCLSSKWHKTVFQPPTCLAL